MLSPRGYGRLAELTVDAARRLCDERLVAEHEGGYSAELVPFCGLAILEAMSGITTECTGTILHEFPAHLAGQALQPHHAAVRSPRWLSGVWPQARLLRDLPQGQVA